MTALHHYDIIRSPIVTEKSAAQGSFGKVVFLVAKSATKPAIRAAVESLFDVKVIAVNTAIVKGKETRFRGIKGRRADRKKAVVTLEGGRELDLSAGLA